MAGKLDNTSPLGKPWRFSGTAMQPNTLILCKLLFILLVAHNFQDKLGDPYLPFIRLFDAFGHQPGLFAWLSKAAFWMAGLALVFNLRVRTAAITLGATIILAILASKPLFQNHVFIVGCLFLLAGLHRRGENPWLIRYQFVLMYLGAFVNKSLEADWWTGRFMNTWLHEHLHNPYYEALSPLFPELWFAAGVSWMIIVSECVLMVLFLVRRWNSLGVGLALGMHLSFMVLIGGPHFGYFTEDILIALLAFLTWPETRLELRLKSSMTKVFKPFLFLLNWDRQFQLSEPIKNQTSWIELRKDDRVMTNLRAVVCFLKYNAAFYVALFFIFNGTIYLLSRF